MLMRGAMQQESKTTSRDERTEMYIGLLSFQNKFTLRLIRFNTDTYGTDDNKILGKVFECDFQLDMHQNLRRHVVYILW